MHVGHWLVLSLFSPLQFRTFFPREWFYAQWAGLPTLINLIKTIPTCTPVGQPNVDNPLLRLSAQVILGCVKLKLKAVITDTQYGKK